MGALSCRHAPTSVSVAGLARIAPARVTDPEEEEEEEVRVSGVWVEDESRPCLRRTTEEDSCVYPCQRDWGVRLAVALWQE